MPEFRYAHGRITESLEYIAGEMSEFDNEYAEKDLNVYQQDRKLQKLMDRTVENILTALIEICGTIMTEKKKAIENYAQALSGCAEEFGFTAHEQQELAKLALHRNRIVHRYLDFRWQAIAAFVKIRPLIKNLLEKILARESDKGSK